MDAGATGALIGIGVMACGVIVMVCEAKVKPVLQRWIQRHREQKQTLLPVVKTNPMVVLKRSQSKVKNLFPGK